MIKRNEYVTKSYCGFMRFITTFTLETLML